MTKVTLFFLLINIFSTVIHGKDQAPSTNSPINIKKPLLDKQQLDKINKKRKANTVFGYIDREHTSQQTLKHLGGIYLVSWAIYPLTQPKVFIDNGSWDNYSSNFGKLVFDRDEPFWNWFVHPISGSQLYLYYRANGYNRSDAFGLAFISSALFEFTVEIYTEPASIQDLYQTPVIGSILGVGIETLSMYLLNSGNIFAKTIGHIINPSTLFWFYEGKVNIIPQTDFKSKAGLYMSAEF